MLKVIKKKISKNSNIPIDIIKVLMQKNPEIASPDVLLSGPPFCPICESIIIDGKCNYLIKPKECIGK